MRLATFNIESFGGERDEDAATLRRLAILRPQIERLEADVLCLQEVNAQRPMGGGPRRLTALAQLIDGLECAGFHRISTTDANGHPRDRHNLVTLSRFPVLAARQIWHDHIAPPLWRMASAEPPESEPLPISWERPIQHLTLDWPQADQPLHLLNLHLRAPLAVPIPGGKASAFLWTRTGAWAEGYAIAAIKRIGQAVEARQTVDALFDDDPRGLIAVAGDFNAEGRESPMRILFASEDDTGNGALADRVMTPADRGLSADRRYTVLHHGRPQMLDHILLSRALLGRLQATDVHNETLGDELIAYHRTEKPPESLHAPLVITLRD